MLVFKQNLQCGDVSNNAKSKPLLVSVIGTIEEILNGINKQKMVYFQCLVNGYYYIGLTIHS